MPVYRTLIKMMQRGDSDEHCRLLLLHLLLLLLAKPRVSTLTTLSPKIHVPSAQRCLLMQNFPAFAFLAHRQVSMGDLDGPKV